MKRLIPLLLFLLPLTASATTLFPSGGGTGSTSLTGILFGNGTSPIQTLTIGSNLTLSGSTLSATGGGGSSTFGTTSISALLPLVWDTSTAQLSTLFSTTTNNGIGNNVFLYNSNSGVMKGAASSSLDLPNSALQNSSISGISLGSNLSNLIAGSGLSGSNYNGGSSQTFTLDLTHANTWTGQQTFNTSAPIFGTITGSTQCLHVSSSGLVSGTGSDCGTGSGGVTGVATTYPLQTTGSTGAITLSTAFGTTTGWGIGNNGFVVTSNTGVPFVAASSTLDLPNSALQNSTISSVALGSNLNNVTFNNGGSGASSGSTYNGSSALTVSYNTIGAQVAGTYVTGVTGTWPIVSSGGTTPALSYSGFGTTSDSGIGHNLMLYTSNSGVVIGAATSTLSIGGNAGTATKLATGRTISITGDLSYTSPSFDGSGNVTAAGTLATVNSNIGSFTNASITVNGKGLITAASNGTAPVTSVSGTANQITSSGGTTPTLSLPNHVIFPGDFLVGNSTTTNATTTGSVYFTGITASRGLYVDSTGKLGSLGTGTSGNCVEWGSNNTLSDTGSACGSGGGGSTPLSVEVPSGTIDGSNKSFTVVNTPVDAVFLNGVYQTPGGADVTISGTSITFTNAPTTGSSLASFYGGGANSLIAYPFGLTGNATSTLTQFNGGLTAYASTTVGNGTAAGGLTVSGTATTTDVAAGLTGIQSPVRHLTFTIATSTITFTGTSTPGVDISPSIVSTFAGTIEDAYCSLNTFLGIEIDIAGSAVTPSYFVASSTVGKEIFTANNTFTTGQILSWKAGTTTSATASSGVVNGSCTLDVIQTQ